MPTNAPDAEPKFTLDATPHAARAAAGPRVPTPTRSGRPLIAALVVLALVVAAMTLYYLWRRGSPPSPPAPSTPAVVTTAPPAPPQPAILNPIEKIPVVPPEPGAALASLPALDGSDTLARDAISTTVNGDDFVQLLAPGALVRHIVATVDNLPRKTIATRIRPVKPVPGAFATTDIAGKMAIADRNALRYAAYVSAADAIDAKRLVGFYVRLYPLFQQAYVELGYPHGYFNDRLIVVIDHLLAAPEPKPPLFLAQPKVLYEFADPDLEQLSAGQKIMVRVGPDNEARLKAKLAAIRKALTAQPVKP
jgi:hypothetical protein